MGNSPLTVCMHQVWEKQTVQVVHPDGQVLYMPQPMTVSNLLEAHPCHFVCHGSPSLMEQRLPADTKLESGEIYYLLPIPRPNFPDTPSFQKRPVRPRSRKINEKVAYRPPPYVYDKTSASKITDYTQLNLKPHGCLIKFFVFRQSVASAVSPEESFKLQADCYTPRPPARKYQKFDTNTHKFRGIRGRRPIITWRPHLESISELKPVQEFTKKNGSSFSVSFLSNIKLSAAPAMKVPAATITIERECQKQKLMYSA